MTGRCTGRCWQLGEEIDDQARTCWAVASGLLNAPASADLRITVYDTIKPAEAVRSCIVQVLKADAQQRRAIEPTLTPLTNLPTNDGWTISFRYRGQQASIVVLAEGVAGARVLYPTHLGIIDENLSNRVENCG